MKHIHQTTIKYLTYLSKEDKDTSQPKKQGYR